MLDTETTGLHPEEGATIIEIGALLVTPGNENARPRFEQLVDPQRPLPEFITDLTGISDGMLRGKPTADAAMLRLHQWLDDVWPAGRPLTVIAHNAEFDIGFLDAAERAHDPDANEFDCRWLCTKEMSWELNPRKRHHRVSDLIVDYRIGDVEEHRALSDAIQEQMIYRALCREASMKAKWNEMSTVLDEQGRDQPAGFVSQHPRGAGIERSGSPSCAVEPDLDEHDSGHDARRHHMHRVFGKNHPNK